MSDTRQTAQLNVTNIDRPVSLAEDGACQRFASRQEGDLATYFADPISSKERPLSNFAMSASNSNEVLTLDKR